MARAESVTSVPRRYLPDRKPFLSGLHGTRARPGRTLLVSRPEDVAGVGHLVGYDSPTQFSREYRRLFGAPPSQDAAALRAASGPHAIPETVPPLP